MFQLKNSYQETVIRCAGVPAGGVRPQADPRDVAHPVVAVTLHLPAEAGGARLRAEVARLVEQADVVVGAVGVPRAHGCVIAELD